MSVTVRLARDEELEAAGAVVAAAYLAMPGMADETGDDGYLTHVRDARGRARDCELLVAVDASGAIVGCVSYIPGPDSPLAEAAREGEAEFRMLGVAPTAQRSGVGGALVEACIDRARAAARTALVLSTPPDWTMGPPLYDRLGFRREPSRDWEPAPGFVLHVYVLVL